MSLQPVLISDVDVAKVSAAPEILQPRCKRSTVLYNGSPLIFETPEIDFSRTSEFITHDRGYNDLNVIKFEANQLFKTFLKNIVIACSSIEITKRGVFSLYPSDELRGKTLTRAFSYHTSPETGELLESVSGSQIEMDSVVDFNKLFKKNEKLSGKFICEASLQRKLISGSIYTRDGVYFEQEEDEERGYRPARWDDQILMITIIQMAVNLPRDEILQRLNPPTVENTARYFMPYSFSDRALHSSRMFNGRDVLAELDEIREMLNYLPGVGIEYQKSAARFETSMKSISGCCQPQTSSSSLLSTTFVDPSSETLL